jgi:FkbM family methyltransferase
MGLDVDGSLFVDIHNGIRLYDRCLDAGPPHAVLFDPGDLVRPENRRLYYSFLATLNEIDGVMIHAAYEGGYRFKRGDVVVDAGARIGTFAAKLSAALGREGRIIAIEPEPRNYACLRKNIEANRLDNVTAIQKMLWSHRQRLDLYLSLNAAAHSAYRDAFYGPTGETVGVEAEDLDGILEALGVDSVDFIKMDIEGSEIEALKGMKRTLQSSVQLGIAAYHPVGGRLTHAVIVPELEALGFEAAYADGIVRAKRSGLNGSSPGR